VATGGTQNHNKDYVFILPAICFFFK